MLGPGHVRTTTMELKRLLTDDDAVSPVIGVILMVAITVILAAVIATFVLGLGDQVSNTAPQASFSFDWDDNTGDEDTLNVTHDGGDTIEAKNLYVRGEEGTDQNNYNANLGQSWDNYNNEAGASNAGTGSPNSAVTAGSTIRVHGIASDGEIDIVWERSTGDNSATLSSWEGPEA